MEKQSTKNLVFRSSQMMILVSYTIFTLILTGESILLGWEAWAVILTLFGVFFSWIIHVQQKIPEMNRIWIYSILMMATFFFYGSHITSTFDLAPVMTAVIILYTMTGIKGLIALNQVTYYITMAYALSTMYLSGEKFDSLVISRIMLHLALVFMVGWVSRTIIDKWDQVLLKSEDEIIVLRDATTRLNDFLANVSHEIRTPINAVIGLTGVCVEKEKDEEIAKDLHSIRDAGRRVAEQISDILDYSEIDSRRLTNNNEDYMIQSLLHDLVVELRPYKRDDIEIIIDVAPSVPSMMNSDVSKLKKILWHLIMNGIKYTKEGGVYVRIFSVEEPYGVNLCIEVRDTGIGMSVEQTERITEGFYQANSGRDRSSSGLGLGMSIVKGFVDALGGFVFVESRLGKGTAVHVSIPQKVVDPSGCMSLMNKEKLCIGAFLQFEKYSNPEVREYYNMMVRNIVKGLQVQMHWAANLESLKKLNESVRMTHLFVAMEEYESDPAFMEELAKKMIVSVVANRSFSLPKNSNAKIMEKPFYCFPVTIVLNTDRESLNRGEKQMRLDEVKALVVDDEPMNLTVARGIFKQYGMTVKTADSGQESIDMCSQEDFDLVFMDHMMPGMDGVEAMKRIRSLRRDLPVVALTANAVSTAKEMFIREGFAGFVSKPVELAELERVLKAVLPASKITYVEKTDDELSLADGGKGIPDERVMNAPEDQEHAALAEAGVDIGTGLHYCQNDSEFYRELMEQYVTEAEEKKKGIEKSFGEGDFKNYAIYVHALKSTSKMIGAVELSEKAKEMEAMAKAGGGEITAVMHDHLLSGYQDIVSAIRAYLHKDEKPAADQEAREVMEFGPESGEKGDALEFSPESSAAEEALEFTPESGGSDDVLEFAPEE